MLDLDETLRNVSNLYRMVTGCEPPPPEAGGGTIPAEMDPVRHVNERMDVLVAAIAALGLPGTAGTGASRGTAGIGPVVASQLSSIAAAAARPTWTPSVTILETDQEVCFYVDVPGVARDRIEVRTSGEMIIVTGQRTLAVSPEQRVRHTEHAYGLFARTLPVLAGGRVADLTATLRDGVLELRMPRDLRAPGSAPARRIPVS